MSGHPGLSVTSHGGEGARLAERRTSLARVPVLDEGFHGRPGRRQRGTRPGQAIRQWPDGAPARTIAWDCGLRRKTRHPRSRSSLNPGRGAGLSSSGHPVPGPVQHQGEAMTTLPVARVAVAAEAPARFAVADAAPSFGFVNWRSREAGASSGAIVVRCARDGPASGSARVESEDEDTIDRFMLFTRVGARGLLIRKMHAWQLDAQDGEQFPLKTRTAPLCISTARGGDAAHWHGRPPRELDVHRGSFPSQLRRRSPT